MILLEILRIISISRGRRAEDARFVEHRKLIVRKGQCGAGWRWSDRWPQVETVLRWLLKKTDTSPCFSRGSKHLRFLLFLLLFLLHLLRKMMACYIASSHSSLPSLFPSLSLFLRAAQVRERRGREKSEERKRETWRRTLDDGFGGTREIEEERNDRWLPW